MRNLCDKCGEPLIPSKNGYIDWKHSARFWISAVGEHHSDLTTAERMDFCEECYEKFINWLETEV